VRTETSTALEPLLLDPDGPIVTAVGGGHGQAAALEAIQCYAGDISALVSVADDGGSSGRLSDMGMPPPGDVRRCLLALTPDPSLWSELFAHRFRGGDVAEHSLGNLILAALTDLFGDFESAVETAERMLGAVGTVIPVADHPIRLEATIDGRLVVGQNKISKTVGNLTELHIEPRDAVTTRRALAAVAVADQIVIGPGSLYTSVISALKVNMLAPAIMGADGQKVFILNLVTQDGETLGMSGADHLTALSVHAGISGPGIVISHDRDFEVPEGHERVTLTVEEAAMLGWRVIYADLVDEWAEWPVHDPLKLGQVLEQLTTDATGQ
jgi:uncharacterized cofD-like protein